MESRLSSRMDTDLSSSILPSTSASIPTSFQPMHPQTIKEPPNFTVPWTFLFCKGLPAFFHTYILPSHPITLVQSCKVQSLLVLESKFQPSLSMCGRQRGFFFCTTAFDDVALRILRTFWEEIGEERAELMRWVAWTALSAFPVVNY